MKRIVLIIAVGLAAIAIGIVVGFRVGFAAGRKAEVGQRLEVRKAELTEQLDRTAKAELEWSRRVRKDKTEINKMEPPQSEDGTNSEPSAPLYRRVAAPESEH